jgi:hypothetical protein
MFHQFNLPAAVQINKKQVLVPLKMAAQSGSSDCFEQLIQLPAAQQISGGTWHMCFQQCSAAAAAASAQGVQQLC